MIAVLQRVNHAAVIVAGATVGRIDRGLLVLVSVHKQDAADDVAWTASKLVSLRLFPAGGKSFEVDVKQAGGAILLVSNFTVAADARKGRRPSFDAAAGPEPGRRLFDDLVAATRALGVPVETGQFGADMRVTLENDGPATFLLDSTTR